MSKLSELENRVGLLESKLALAHSVRFAIDPVGDVYSDLSHSMGHEYFLQSDVIKAILKELGLVPKTIYEHVELHRKGEK